MERTELSITWHTIRTQDTLEVNDRAQLLDKPDACIRVGTAPDGLPLVLKVGRAASITEPVLRALHAAEVDALSRETRALLSQLNRQVQSERRGLGITPFGPDGNGPHYVTMATVPELMGETLLSRMLGSTSPLLLPEDGWGAQRSDEVAARTSCGVLMDAAELKRVMRELDTRQHLCVPLDDTAPTIVRRAPDQTMELSDGRPFIEEDLRRMPSTRFHGFRRVDGAVEGESFVGALGDSAAYRRAVRRASTVGWSVTRADLLRMVAEVARALVPLHDSGFVHGDVKPANVLITARGAFAHDALDIQAGTLSAAGTKGWNAPEQIIARPCTPATDVFALAQLVVRILEAAVFGDERSFVVPIGNGRRIRERMIAEPDVFIDPTMIAIDDAGIAAWRAFLRRCLVLDADKRVPDGARFADQLEGLVERHPVGGRRVVSGLVGQLVRRARGDGLMDRARRVLAGEGEGEGEGDDGVVWMLHDSYAHVHQMPWRPRGDRSQ